MKKSHIIIVSIATILLIITIILYSKMPILSLNGERQLVLEVNAEYKEQGVDIKNNKTKVNIIGEVDTSKVGTYKITYETEYLFTNIKQERIIEVKDTEKPVITLVGSDVKICPKKEYTELGYEAIDNYDGNLTDKVKITAFENKILYQVEDSSGNKTEAVRKYEMIDDTKPNIKLTGGDISIYIGDNYSEPGYAATDNCDSNINVTVTGEVDTTKAGNYKIKYTAVDSSNNKNSVIRNVSVTEKTNRTVYLTFDDGPSSLTSKILDVLKKEGVSATFFVAGYPSESILKREANEGHAVGLHTLTHSYKTIYTSETSFFNDINAIGEKVKNAIGYVPDIMRFPGGSSNTVSRNYNKGIMTVLTKAVQEKGFQYFDWNVDSGDASGKSYTSSQICNNVVNGIKNKKVSVVLMHDLSTKTSTYNALSCIIKYGKQNGYEFKSLTKDSTPVHHSVNN